MAEESDPCAVAHGAAPAAVVPNAGAVPSAPPAAAQDAARGGDRTLVAVFAGTVPLARAGSFGYNVRVVPSNPLLASPAELGLVAVAE